MIDVSASLQPWVSQITTTSEGAGQIMLDQPDHAATLVLRTMPGDEVALHLVGPQTKARYHLGTPGLVRVNMRLHPGRARLLLDRPPRDLVDQVLSLPVTHEREGGFVNLSAEVRRLAEALVDGVPVSGKDLDRSRLVTAASDMLVTADIQASARRLHVSERHLRAAFVGEVGLPPKKFARIERIRRVLESGRANTWTDTALEAGYYDHSHMTFEFRSIMGTSPSVFFGGLRSGVHCKGTFERAVEVVDPRM